MKIISSFKTGLRILGLLGALSFGSAARADIMNLSIGIDTTSLVGNAAGPFYLDFQSIFGSGSAQTVTLSNFSFTGGGLPGVGTGFGAVDGSLGSSLVFNPDSANFFNEFFQLFDATVSSIKFSLSMTTNAAGFTPTSFSLALLDSSLANIPTTGLGDSLLLFNIDGKNTNYVTGVSLGATSGARVNVPEASEPLFYGMAIGLAAVAGAWRRRAICAA